MFSRNTFFMAMVAASAVAAQVTFADASADSIMLRKKSAPAESTVQVAAEPVAAESVAAQPVAESVATESVAAEPVASESVAKQAEVSVEKAAEEKSDDKDAKKKKKSNGNMGLLITIFALLLAKTLSIVSEIEVEIEN